MNKLTLKKKLLLIALTLFLVIFSSIATACSCGNNIDKMKIEIFGKEITNENNQAFIDYHSSFDFGSDIKVTLIHKDGTEVVLKQKTDNQEGFEIVGEFPNPLIIGQYSITIKYQSDFEQQIELNIIDFNSIISNVSNISKNYDGNPVSTPTFDISTNQQTELTYFTYQNGALVELSDAPTNAGNYLLQIKALANNQLGEITKNIPFYIAKVYPTEPSKLEQINLTYSPTAKLKNISLPNGYFWTDEELVPNCVQATYDVIYNPDSTNYHNLLTTITINVAKNILNIPEPELDLTFNGIMQKLNIAENEAYQISNNGRINAGEQQVVVSLKDKINYAWEDGTSADLTYVLKIKKAVPVIITPEVIYAKENTPLSEIELPEGFSWSSANPTTVGSNGEKIFFATFTPWDINNFEVVNNVQIKIVVSDFIQIPTQQTQGLTFTNKMQTVNLTAYDSDEVEIVGTTEAKDAGEYTLTAKLKKPLSDMWSDGTTEDKVITWKIKPLQIKIEPKNDENFSMTALEKTYNGNYLYHNPLKFTNITNELPFKVLDVENLRDVTQIYFSENSRIFEFVETEYSQINQVKIYSSNSFDSTKSSIGLGYIKLKYALTNSTNFALGSDNQQDVTYLIRITPATLELNSTIYAGSAKSGSRLADFPIITINSMVTCNLAESASSLLSKVTEINGTWSWENPEQIINDNCVQTAIFVPESGSLNFNQLKIELDVFIKIEDNIFATVQIGNSAPQEFERILDFFTFTSNAIFEEHIIKINLPENTTATHSSILGENLTYSKETGIIVSFYGGIYAETIEFVVDISGEINKKIFITLNIKEANFVVNVNGSEWNGIDDIITGDILTVDLKENNFLNKVLINGTQTKEIFINPEIKTITIQLFSSEEEYSTLTLNVRKVKPFNSITLSNGTQNAQDFELQLSYSVFEYELDLGQTIIDFEFNEAIIQDVTISYIINDKETYLDSNVFGGKIEVNNIDRIIFKICKQDIVLYEYSVNIFKYSIFETIEYTLINNEVVADNKDNQTFYCFVKSINPIMKRSADFALYDENGKVLHLENLVLTNTTKFNVIIKALEKGTHALIETKTITISYNFIIITNSSNINLSTNDSQYVILTTPNQTFNLSLYISFIDKLILKIYDENHTELSLNALVSSNKDEVKTWKFEITTTEINCKLIGEIQVCTRNEFAIPSIFKNTYVNVALKESNSSLSIMLNTSNTDTIMLKATHNTDTFISEFHSSLVENLVSTAYSIKITLNQNTHILSVEILNRNQLAGTLYYRLKLIGEKNSNTNITVKEVIGLHNENVLKIYDDQTKTYIFSRLKTTSSINISAENSFAIIKVFICDDISQANDSTLHKLEVGELSISFSGDCTYVIQIIATDGETSEFYLLNLSGEVQPLIRIVINNKSYDTLLTDNGLSGFFADGEVNESSAFVATLSGIDTSSINSIQLSISLLPTFNAVDSNGNILEEQTNISLNIFPASNSMPAYAYFVLMQDESHIPCYIFFQ